MRAAKLEGRQHREKACTLKPEGRQRRVDARAAKLDAVSIAQEMSLDMAALLCQATGIATVVKLAEEAYERLGRGSSHVGALAQRLSELLADAAREAGWSAQSLFARLLVPALAAMRSPKTRAFGLVLAAAKTLWVEGDWPDPDVQRGEELAGFVAANLLTGSDLMTGAWLMASLGLDRFLGFEDLFAQLQGNMQALRLYCLHARADLRQLAVRRLVDSAAGLPRRLRREILSVAADLIARCELNRADFPEVARQKAINWMCYMVHQVPWHIAEDYANGDVELLTLCVDQLLAAGELGGAAALFRRHEQLLEGRLRPGAAGRLQRAAAAGGEGQDTFAPRDAAALVLPLAEGYVVWADSAALVAVVEAAVRASPVAGVDLEWSSMGDWLEPSLALLQVAVPDQVFLVDLLAEGIREAVDCLLRALFSAVRPLVLCFSFRHDLRELARSPWAQTCKELQGLCDLQLLSRGKAGESEGLASLVRRTLHKPLCKAEQRSCWRRRPLRAAQRHYAALDAFVLLQVGAALSGCSLGNPEGVARALVSLAAPDDSGRALGVVHSLRGGRATSSFVK